MKIMASNQPTLDRLPTEVLESVVALLPLQDICSLRLVSRTIASRSGQGTFRKHFTAKTLEWTSTEQMQEFVHLTQAKWMGCLLQRLTVVGVAAAAGQSHPSDKLLGQALTNLRLNSTHGSLQSIELLVKGQDDNGNIIPCEKVRDWKQVWLTAARTFEMTCRALAESALPVQKLDIFSHVTRCSLAFDQIGPMLDRFDLSKPLEKLRSLSLSMSHPVAYDSHDAVLRSREVGKRPVEDIVRLLELCPQLEELNLHWYNLSIINLGEAQIEERFFFNDIIKLEKISQLRRCRIEGIFTDEEALLAFFKKATELSHLSMEEIHLERGKFGPVFDHLTNNLRHLEHLYMDDLWESRLISFDGPGKPHYSNTVPNGPNDLTRIGGDCRHSIKYYPKRGSPLGSAKCANWLRRKTLRYGPPQC